jgi:hypothetical protein
MPKFKFICNHCGKMVCKTEIDVPDVIDMSLPNVCLVTADENEHWQVLTGKNNELTNCIKNNITKSS